MTATFFADTSPSERQIAARRSIAVWLFAVAGLIAVMVVVGGLTRLTDSGLSITSWKPIHGALPPLSAAAWQEEFDAYKLIPQYQKMNKGMSLDEFKAIFWWEWSHRNMGRLIGVAFLVPFLIFLARRQIERALIPRLLALFVLGGLQGALGWFMVASGLTERVSVSQYRLVAHLGLALVIYAAILWTALPLWRGAWPMKVVPHRLSGAAAAVLALVFFQILLGGFVAGLDAGLTYNTWPLMDGAFVPEGAYAYAPFWLAPFEDVTTVQFNHRIVAYVLTAAVVALWVAGRRQGLAGFGAATANALFAVLAFQVLVGIWTLLEVVPIWLGALHQFGAVVLLTAAVVHLFALRSAPSYAAKA
jgi:cytochrome c oxidase assembly protein subunit 15